MAKLNTRPEAIEVDFKKSALIVVDMQNAFASKGGMMDLAGVDISNAQKVKETIRLILDPSRRAGIRAIYLQMGYKTDLSDSGGPDSPNWHKELALILMRRNPALKGKLLVEGTWDFAIVDELRPQPGDLVLTKTRYSGFAGTELDSMLRGHGIRYLFFTGIATNVCVESTLRDAYFSDYWPILISDAVMQAGPPYLQEATLFNVETFFGWTLTSKGLLDALRSETSGG